MAPARKKLKLSDGDVAADQAAEIHEGVQPLPATQDEAATRQNRSLFVRSLPASTTSRTLTDLFSESYPIKHATAVIDPTTQQCKGYGFVTFADGEDAQRAKEEFNGHMLDGRRLRIEVAEARHRESAAHSSETVGKRKFEKKDQAIPQPSRLIVRNLPWTIKTSEQLTKLFLSYGKVKQAYIPQMGPRRMAGFGFVVLRGRKNAEKALAGVNGKEIDGRTLAVDWAVSKEAYDKLLTQDTEREPVEDSDNNGVQDNGNQDDGSAADVGDEEDVSHGSEDETDNVDDGDEDVDVQMEEEDGNSDDPSEDRSTTLFVRNLPFTCTDEDLEDHFARFGSTRYARVVMDQGTERSKGTGFVCFYNKSDADACLRSAPRRIPLSSVAESKYSKAAQSSSSILQNEDSDPNGQFTMNGRVLQVSRAVDKSEANRLTQEGAAHRHKRNEDKRRLYLLSEGTISSKSKLWEKFSPTERNMREASAKQRKKLIESNPSLHLSLTRLSIRNIPRSIGSKELKSLAREAVVAFATDVKAGLRQKLSKEELARGGEDMQAAEKARKKAGKGLVKQAKVVFEGAGGSKVSEETGAGRSRGYGFIEFFTHRSALMGLRWLNGHAVGYQVTEGKKGKTTKEEVQDRKKRLIVEFAIENAQVVMRRNDREQKVRERSEAGKSGAPVDDDKVPADMPRARNTEFRKRKRGPEKASRSSSNPRDPKTTSNEPSVSGSTTAEKNKVPQKKVLDEKTARRNQIIGRKRARRQARKGAR